MSKLKPQDLINHLYKYKDAVVIVGDHVIKERNNKVDEDTKDILNRKNMVKDPKFFWEYYYVNFYQDYEVNENETEESISELIDFDLVSSVINQPSYCLYDEHNKNVIDLKGKCNEAICVKCRKIYNIKDVVGEVAGNTAATCECKGRLKPTVPMYNEKYDVVAYEDTISSIVKDDELQTHTLICIGVDFTEDIFHELVQNFRALKYSTEETRFLVIITDGDVEVINSYEADFATAGEMKESIERLIKLIKEGEK